MVEDWKEDTAEMKERKERKVEMNRLGIWRRRKETDVEGVELAG